MNSLPPLNHNVYILGAGFSHEAGFPLMADFMDKMQECQRWLATQSFADDNQIEVFNTVFEFQRTANSACAKINIDPNNIEDLFSLASASFNKPLQKALISALAQTINYADTNKYLDKHLFRLLTRDGTVIAENNQDVYSVYAQTITGKFRDNRGPVHQHYPESCNTIITFNYDTLLEETFYSINEPFNYGFDSGGCILQDSSISSKEENSTPILKIHGSVNWGGKKVFRNFSELTEANEVPLIIPPTWQKTIDANLVRVWSKAVEALSTAKNIIIIGFSIPQTDVHFKYLVAAGLRNNTLLRKVFFVNPGLSDKTGSQLKENLYSIFRRDIGGVDIVFKERFVRDFLTNSDCLNEINRLPANNLIGFI